MKLKGIGSNLVFETSKSMISVQLNRHQISALFIFVVHEVHGQIEVEVDQDIDDMSRYVYIHCHEGERPGTAMVGVSVDGENVLWAESYPRPELSGLLQSMTASHH